MKAQHHIASEMIAVAHAAPAAPLGLVSDASFLTCPDTFGPAVAEQYAAMIARYWRQCQLLTGIDFERPLDILDLCPQRDGGGILLIDAIRRRYKATDTSLIRYFPILVERSATDSDPGVADTARQLLLDESFIRFSSQPSTRSSLSLYRPDNPLVVIAHDAWAQLPQELFAIHYGKLLRANLSIIRDDDPEAEKKCWESADDFCWDSRLRLLLAHYRLELNSSPLVYPRGALQILEAIHAIADRGVLILSCASGCANDLALRLTSFGDVTSTYRKTGRLPTNFRILAEWSKAQRGVAAEVELPERRVLQMLVFGDEFSSKELLGAVNRCVDVSLLSSAHHLAEVVRTIGTSASLDLRLGLLQLSRFDPEVFRAGAADLLRALSQPGKSSLHLWRDALDRVWQNHLLCHSDNGLYPWISQAAMHCGHWGLARKVLCQSLADLGTNPSDLANLSWCEARTGKLGTATELVTQALALDPDHVLANEVGRRLSERLALRDGCWNVELHGEALPIVLEPLDASHAQALSHQYRDAQIAIMTGLPALSDPDAVRQWIVESHKDAGRVNYAVMHRDWGFVGFINLAVSGHAAFFCFWTGVDFQGQGFATAAGRLACRHAATCGVPMMLTSAYKDNHRSLRALERMGFRKLAIRAQPPDHERIFFALLDEATDEIYDCDAELVAYYRRENLPMEFVMPEKAKEPIAFDLNVVGSMP